MAILYYFEDIPVFKFQRLLTKQWVKDVILAENHKLGDINFIFCSDNYLLDMNKQYLEHDYYTDVITFDYVENKLVSGDIFISIDRVKDNASEYKVSFLNELNRMLIHGVLHLLGYKDKEPSDKKIMTEKEDLYLKELLKIEKD